MGCQNKHRKNNTLLRGQINIHHWVKFDKNILLNFYNEIQDPIKGPFIGKILPEIVYFSESCIIAHL